MYVILKEREKKNGCITIEQTTSPIQLNGEFRVCAYSHGCLDYINNFIYKSEAEEFFKLLNRGNFY